jgi:hypothetical protein
MGSKMNRVASITRVLAALFLTTASIFFMSGKAFAGSATMYLSPASGNIAPSSTLTISIRENSSEDSVNVVQANLTYPADLLEFLSVDSSESGFNIKVKEAGGKGTVEIIRGAIPPVSGDQLVAYLKFYTKADARTANISFSSGKVINASDHTDILSSTSGGTYTIKPPTPAAATSSPPATINSVPAESHPALKVAPLKPAVASENKKISIAVTIPNTQRAKEQPYIGFWIPLMALVLALSISVLAAKDYRLRSVSRHFHFIRPLHLKKYIHE